MNKFSLMSFILGLLALVDLLILIFEINLSFFGIFAAIIIYLPLLGILAGVISFFLKPNKKELILSILGIVLSVILYVYLFYIIIQLGRTLSGF